MALEDTLTKLVAALDANTAALKAKGANAAATGTTTKPGEKTVKFDELKAAAAKVMDRQGKPFTKKLIKDVGGGNELATVKPEKYPALMIAFEKALGDEVGVEEEEEEL